MRKAIVAFAAVTLSLTACAVDQAAPEAASTQSDALYAQSNKLWQRPIRVCWNLDGWDKEKTWVRDAIESTWMHESNVEFHDWSRCPAWDWQDDYDYMIDVRDERSHSNLGTDGGHIVLNFVYRASSLECNTSEAKRESCIKATAVHEFGHAMGFAHEQNRVDGAPCVAERDGTGNWALTPYDRESVMNYTGDGPGCNPLKNNGGQLSPSDIKGARAVYGAKAHGSLVGFGGNCLDVAGGATTNGANIQMFDCNPGTAQRWWYDQATGSVWGPGNKVVDIPGLSSNNGTAVHLWSYWGGENQRFAFQNVEIRHYGKCLDRGNGANGAPITLQRCNGSIQQKWELGTNGELRNAVDPYCGFFCGERKCLDVKDMRKENFAPLQSWSCWGGESQVFKIGSGGDLRVYSGGETKCVDLPYGSTEDGTVVGIYDCHGGEPQKFSYRGNLVAYSGAERQGHRSCLETYASGRTNHSDVTIWDCHGGFNQVFEYYP